MTGEKNQALGPVPKLRFPEFQDAGAWDFQPLITLAKRRNKRNAGEDIIRVLTNSAEHGVIDQKDYFEKDIAIQGNLETYFVVELGDYVYNPRISSMAPVGPIGKNKVGTGVMSPLYTIFGFDSDQNGFYEQFFRSDLWHDHMRLVSNSGARHDRMAVSNDDFMAMPIPAPSSAEQRKIANCLSSLDAVIAAEGERLAALKHHKKGLMQALFPAEGQTTPRLRFPEFRDAGEWQEQPLDSLCVLLNNRRQPVSSAERKPGGYPYYGASGIVDHINDYIFDERLLLVGEDGAKWGAFEATAFLVEGRYWVNNHAHVLRPTGVNDRFLEQYLVKADLATFVSGAAPPKLTLGKLKTIQIPLPPLRDEQDRIADCLFSLGESIVRQATRVEALKSHKSGLMQQLFPSPAKSDS